MLDKDEGDMTAMCMRIHIDKILDKVDALRKMINQNEMESARIMLTAILNSINEFTDTQFD